MDGVSRKVVEGFSRTDEDEGGEIAEGRLDTAFSARNSRASRSRVEDDALPSAAFSRSRFRCA